mmetsp:Transcript_18202/g.46580  ORF Transcript_18202/g.46580 Transcript_18202/m.46580 type:complete len:143 (+) Transcript_18202:31-459(+)
MARATVLCLAAFALAARAEATVALKGFKTTYEVVSPGQGKAVSKGASITVHATGSVVESGKKFWSTKDAGQTPFEYVAGVGSVIVGWDQGCLGMQTGEVRKLSIPAEEGYGANGFPAWGIPPKATLLFEIEVLKMVGGKDEI